MGKLFLEPSVVPDIVGNYETARDCFQEGNTNIAPAAVLLETPRTDEFLTNAEEISAFIQFLAFDYVSISEGCETFCQKLAYMAYRICKIEGEVDTKINYLIDRYPCLTTYLDYLRDYLNNGGTVSGFDDFNMGDYESWKNNFIDKKDDIFTALKNYNGDIDKLKEDLKKIFPNPDFGVIIDSLVDSLVASFELEANTPNTNKQNKFLGLGVSVVTMLTLVALASRGGLDINALKGLISPGASVGADNYFNFTDTALWTLNTPISLFLEHWAGNAAGPVTAAIIGLVIACADGEFDPQVFIEEAIPAVTGATVTTGLIALGCGAFFPVLMGLGVTVLGGMIIGDMMNCAGIDRIYDDWSEKEQEKYLYDTYGIDMDKLRFYKKVVDSDVFTLEEIEDIINDYFESDGVEVFDPRDPSNYNSWLLNICFNDSAAVSAPCGNAESYMSQVLLEHGVPMYFEDGTVNEYFYEALKDLVALREALYGGDY